MTVTPYEVRRALHLLGRTSNTIAVTLEHKGIVGRLEHDKECPIAVYLQQQFPELDEVWVDENDISYQDGTEEGGMFAPSLAVRLFIRRFDDGAYPNLVAECLGIP